MTGIVARFPGGAFRLSSFRPDRELAVLAALLIRNGFETRVHDYATTDIFCRLHPDEIQSSLAELCEPPAIGVAAISASHLAMSWRNGRLHQHHRSRLAQVLTEIADEIAEESAPYFVAFKIDSAECMDPSVALLRQLKSLRPEVHCIVFGSALKDSPVLVRKARKLVDLVFPSSDLIGIAAQISGLRSKNGIGDSSIEREVKAGRVPLPHPCYDPDVYTALAGEGKIRVFDVHESGGGECDAATVAERVAFLQRRNRSCAFHFHGDGPKLLPAETLAAEIISRRLALRYSRDAHVSSTPPSSLAILKASGCRAMNFRVDTGSQRLLDSYYRHGFTVSEIERIVRTSKFFDIFSSLHFTYPSPEDDYHTRDETLRLIGRACPDSALCHPSSQENESAWTGVRVSHRILGEVGWKRSSAGQIDRIRADIHELGVTTEIDAETALIADLAGRRGEEFEFADEFAYSLGMGDTSGIASIVGFINESAATVPSAQDTFAAYRNAVVN